MQKKKVLCNKISSRYLYRKCLSAETIYINNSKIMFFFFFSRKIYSKKTKQKLCSINKNVSGKAYTPTQDSLPLPFLCLLLIFHYTSIFSTGKNWSPEWYINVLLTIWFRDTKTKKKYSLTCTSLLRRLIASSFSLISSSTELFSLGVQRNRQEYLAMSDSAGRARILNPTIRAQPWVSSEPSTISSPWTTMLMSKKFEVKTGLQI